MPLGSVKFQMASLGSATATTQNVSLLSSLWWLTKVSGSFQSPKKCCRSGALAATTTRIFRCATVASSIVSGRCEASCWGTRSRRSMRTGAHMTASCTHSRSVTIDRYGTLSTSWWRYSTTPNLLSRISKEAKMKRPNRNKKRIGSTVHWQKKGSLTLKIPMNSFLPHLMMI